MVMWGVFTSPRYRRQGLSRQVIETALQHAFDNGVRRVNLQVYVPNEPAITLYKAIGFVDRRSGRRGTRLDRKRRGVMEVAPTKVMLVAEFMSRYSWAAWVMLSVALVTIGSP
jgi:RimJ/RimL family protein N-acetyltransferase